MVLLKIAGCFFPLMVFVKDAQMIAKVEVFIPPPVELEEDPTNIKNNIRIRKGTPRPKPSAALKSTVLKPDVRVTDWNREVIIDSPKFFPTSVLLYSNK